MRYTRRGYFISTDEGKKVLAKKPDRIDSNFLKQFDAFQDFRNRRGPQSANSQDTELPEDQLVATPDEILRAAHRNIVASLAADLVDRVRQSTPQFFEKLIVELLVSMGYGGTSEDASYVHLVVQVMME